MHAKVYSFFLFDVKARLVFTPNFFLYLGSFKNAIFTFHPVETVFFEIKLIEKT